ncbi:MAG: helix-turn-helix transcriptional regulator [Acidimicrobiales bacterium]
MTGPENTPAFGEHLRRWRRAKGLTQEDVARALKVNQSSWAKWENGKALPDRRHYLSIAALLELEVGQVVALCLPSSRQAEDLAGSGSDGLEREVVSLPLELYYALSALAKAQGTTIDAQLDRAIHAYLRGLR